MGIKRPKAAFKKPFSVHFHGITAEPKKEKDDISKRDLDPAIEIDGAIERNQYHIVPSLPMDFLPIVRIERYIRIAIQDIQLDGDEDSNE